MANCNGLAGRKVPPGFAPARGPLVIVVAIAPVSIAKMPVGGNDYATPGCLGQGALLGLHGPAFPAGRFAGLFVRVAGDVNCFCVHTLAPFGNGTGGDASPQAEVSSLRSPVSSHTSDLAFPCSVTPGPLRATTRIYSLNHSALIILSSGLWAFKLWTLLVRLIREIRAIRGQIRQTC